MKLFEKKPQDERVEMESNKTYKIGFYVFTVGILADILLTVLRDGAFNWMEWAVFMAAQIVCVIVNTRKGITDKCIDPVSDTFPLKRVLAPACAVGSLMGVFTCVVYAVRNGWNTLPPLQIAAASCITFSFLFALTTGAIVAIQAVVFVAAKARLNRMLNGQNEEDE